MRIWIASVGLPVERWSEWHTAVEQWLSRCHISAAVQYRWECTRLAQFDYHFEPLDVTCQAMPATPLVFDGWIAESDSAAPATGDTLVESERLRLIETLRADPTALSRATGEFSLAAWDAQDRQLIVASDIYSTCPIYYWIKPGAHILVSNDLRALLLADAVPFEINYEICERYISFAFMLGENELSGQTFFKGIRKLPPATILRWAQGRATLTTYWGIANILNDTMITEDAAGYFAEHMRRVVTDRIMAGGRIVGLSGGLDSATVLAAAISAGHHDQLMAVNMSFASKEMPASHDLGIVRQLLKDWRIPGIIIYGDALLRVPNAESGSDPLTFLDGPDPSATPLAREAIAAAAHTLGGPKILTGEGGDPLVGGEVMILDSLLRQRRVHETLHLLKHWSRKRLSSILDLSFKFGIAPFLPFWRTKLYYWINWQRDELEIPNFLTDTQRRRERSWLAQYRARYAQSAPFKLWGHRFAYDFLWPRARYFDALNIPYGHFHPFLDRRMLEFIFRVTPEQHCNVLVDYNSFYRGTKLLPRRAFRDVFPDYMYNRQSKTSYALMARKCVLNVRRPLLAMFAPDRRTNVAELGIIDQRRFRDHLIATLIRAEDPNNDLGELYQYTRGIIDLEIWLREIQGCRQTVLERARPQRPRTLAETETIGI